MTKSTPTKKATTIPVVVRKFQGTPNEMLTTITLLLEIVLQRKTDLLKYYTNWKDPFFKNITDLIDQIIKDYIGVDGAKNLRGATKILDEIQVKALKDLTSLKVQIETNIKDKSDREEYLKQLGYNSYYFEAKRNNDQMDTIMLLFQADKSLDTKTQTALTAKNVVSSLLTNIKSYAKTLNDANITQESLKKTRADDTVEAINAFNNVYEQAMDVLKLTTNYFIDDKAYTKQLSYAATLKTVKGNSKKGKGGDDNTATTNTGSK